MKEVSRARNAAAKELASGEYGPRVVKAAKGKGSYSRKTKARVRISDLRLSFSRIFSFCPSA